MIYFLIKKIFLTIENTSNKKISHKGKPRSKWPGKLYQTYKEESTPVLRKLFQKIKEKGIFPTHFMRCLSLINITGKENYRPVPLMNKWTNSQ